MLLQKLFLFLLFLFVLAPKGQAQQQQYTLSGTVRSAWGERLEEAYMVINPGNKIVATGEKGRFSITLEEGTYQIICQYVGMEPFSYEVVLNEDLDVNLELVQRNFQLKQVEITTQPTMDVNSTHLGSTYVDQKLLARMPALLGEADVIRSVSSLPGVVNAGEGTSGFYVRGGSADQNLILLDDAPVFNANHLFGFFSIYNPDVLESYELHRSGISAKYGSRISSILDVKMQDGNFEKMRYQVGLSPITAKLSADGPITPKLSMLVALRGAYPDYVLKLFPSDNIRNSSGYFYDGNLKFKYQLNEKNNFSFSGYYSADGFKFPYDTTYHWTNTLGTLKWNHLFNNDFAGTLTLVKSLYQNTVEGIATGEEFKLKSGIDYAQVKADLGYYGLDQHELEFGTSAALYDIQPGDLIPYGTSSLNRRTQDRDKGYEYTAYLNDSFVLNEKLSLSIGLRYSFFRKVGPAEVYLYAEGVPRSETSVYDTLRYSSGEAVQHYQGLEPRFSVKYSLNAKSSLKLGLSRTRQYIQLISNTAAITPVDVWKLSNKYMEPQVADQVTVGYFYMHPERRYEFTWEVYYRKLYNQLDYKDGAVILLNPTLEADLLYGEGEAYGSEWLLKKSKGRLTGWLSLSYSRSFRTIAGNTPEETINNGAPYPSNYDKPVNISIFTNYHLTPKWTFSSNFNYSTGRPITGSDSWFNYHGNIFANYYGRNQERLPDYHRLDISFNYTFRKSERVEKNLSISVYNLYFRKNAYSTLFQHYFGAPPMAYRLAVIGVAIPSVSYNIKF
ncbi:outer membrane receptor protein involved in Fe transport [Pontibacter ummariensis]|uniref:Outer membrane receptor proteins, mostly Fe transport n=1 Tax=Pontibacter ummariensis TaxID=1610492 RepID=A0A239FHB2_9BACT|nr:TonB-dependent receptor [Pontibacter ummariensis]PRY12260.1 outer membrane receptor protein involved in Fe transport [Pontibacter ummariensis]SNS56131.1 Outer membrane receptor proteins, mostly Fe transport [Pontibacter ummariensis]